MDKETAEWARIVFPKSLEWKFIRLLETFRGLVYWWKPKESV